MPNSSTQDHELTAAKIQIATLEVQFANLSAQFFDVKSTLAALSIKLDAVNTTLTEARGGWRTLMIVGGAASSLTAVLVWIVQHLPRAGA